MILILQDVGPSFESWGVCKVTMVTLFTKRGYTGKRTIQYYVDLPCSMLDLYIYVNWTDSIRCCWIHDGELSVETR